METNGNPEENQMYDENPQTSSATPIAGSVTDDSELYNSPDDQPDLNISNEQDALTAHISTSRTTSSHSLPLLHPTEDVSRSSELPRNETNNDPASSEPSEGASNSQGYGWGKVTSLLPFLGSASSERPTNVHDHSTQCSFVQQKDFEKTTSGLQENGTIDEYSDDDLSCPICHEIMKDVFMVVCGHSYCHACISQHIQINPDCPLCRRKILQNQIYPNFQLNRVAEQRARTLAKSENNANLMASLYERKGKKINYELLAEKLAEDMSRSGKFEIKKLPYVLILSKVDIVALFNRTLDQCKRIESNNLQLRKNLLRLFLVKLRAKNKEAIKEMESQLVCIEEDLRATGTDESVQSSSSQDIESSGFKKQRINDGHQLTSSIGNKRRYEDIDDSGCEKEEEKIKTSEQSIAKNEVIKKKQRIEDRFEDLRELYLGTCGSTRTPESIDNFSSMLYQVTRYSQFKVLDTLYYTDIAASSSIVSSIEFDRDDEYFAVGGVTKEIKIYDFSMMGDGSAPNTSIPENEFAESTEDGQDVPARIFNSNASDNESSGGGYVGRFRPSSIMHCPVRIMRCSHKISCLSWNTYIKSQIASSDYEGVVNIWDASSGTCIRAFNEHKRRVWSVDTCSANPLLLASGSDDSTVKIWSTQMRQSVHTLGQKGNVCCAKFAPNSSYKLAVGSADHNISCYDLRFPNKPFRVFKGHRKAVSYVQWASNDEIVSANKILTIVDQISSTDNTLKLWNLESKDCIRTFTGHQNEKNFVGLSLNEDWIACGSETNTLYMYYKGSRIPVANYRFPDVDNMIRKEECKFCTYTLLKGNEVGDTEPPVFVSSLCWKNNSTRIVAANSKGMIKVLCLE
ncbi:WD40-repeat-containing domain protein [Phycomyces blakesleeanus]